MAWSKLKFIIIIIIITITTIDIHLSFFIVISQNLESTQWKCPACAKIVSFSMHQSHDDANQRLKLHVYATDQKILTLCSFLITIYTGFKKLSVPFGQNWSVFHLSTLQTSCCNCRLAADNYNVPTLAGTEGNIAERKR